MTVFVMVAIATMTAIAIQLIIFEDDQPFVQEIKQIVVPREIALETTFAAGKQSSEPVLSSAERNWPRHPTNRLNSGLPLDDTAAKSVGQDLIDPKERNGNSTGCCNSIKRSNASFSGTELATTCHESTRLRSDLRRYRC
jgi:hypothetical protein